MGEVKKEQQYLTRQIATEYQNRAQKLSANGCQDVGERRKLRIELQERCGLTEVEAINILNGHHTAQYINKYSMLQNNVSLKGSTGKNLAELEAEIQRLQKKLGDDYVIVDD